MQQGTDGTTIASTQLVTAYGPQNVPCPGNGAVTMIVNWTDIRPASAAFGAVLRVENAGPDPVDAIAYRGAYNPGGPYNETIDAVAVPVGEAREIAVQDSNVNIPPPWAWASVTVNGPNGANVTVRIVRRDF